MPNSILFAEIRKLMPYSHPLTLVDYVIDWEPNKWIEVKKVISGTDPLVNAHFPQGPAIFPGVLLIEFVGQAGLLLNILSANSKEQDSSIDLLARCKANFYKAIHVGDIVTAKVSREVEVNKTTLIHGDLWVDDMIACKVDLYATNISNYGSH